MISNTDSVTVRRVTIPMDVVAGDMGIIAITYQQTDTNAGALSISGWTRIGEAKVSDYRTAVFYRVLGIADRGTDVEVTFGSAQRAPMLLEVWAGLEGAPVADWNAHSTAVTTHPVDTVGSSGRLQPFAIFGARTGPTPPTTASPPSGYVLRQFGVRPDSYTAITGFASASDRNAPIGGGSFGTSSAVTSITWSIGFPVKPDGNNLKVHSLGMAAMEAPPNKLRLHRAYLGASLVPYSIRRGNAWSPLSTFVRRGGSWK